MFSSSSSATLGGRKDLNVSAGIWLNLAGAPTTSLNWETMVSKVA
jgi:hypothetical protein